MALLRVILVGLGMLGSILEPAMTQESGFRGWDQIRDDSFQFDPDLKVILPYRPVRAREARLVLERCEDLLQRENYADAMRLYQDIIDRDGHSVLQVAYNRYVGAAEYVRYLLSQLPPLGLAAYHNQSELRSRSELQRALERRDQTKLRSIARKYANALVGQEALAALARLARQSGNRQLAVSYSRRLLDFLQDPAPGSLQESLRDEAFATLALHEDPAKLDEHRFIDSALIGGESRELRDLVRSREQQPTPSHDDDWLMYGGNPERNRPMRDPVAPIRLEQSYLLPVPPAEFADDRDNPLPNDLLSPVQPARQGEIVYINNTFSVRAFNLFSNRLEWEFLGPMTKDLGSYFNARDYTSQYRLDTSPVSKGLIGGVAVGRDVVLANLQVPEPSRKVQRIGSRITINLPYAWRGLFALDASNGELLWSQRGRAVEDSFRGQEVWVAEGVAGDLSGVASRLDVLGPPVIVDDMVFALGHFIEGAVNSYLLALDLKTGALRYAVPLVTGQQELSMFDMPFQEFTSGMPVVSNGTVFCPTNLGLVAAVDMAFGDLRWLSAYEAINIIPPPNYYLNTPRPVTWYNNPPCVKDDLLLVTPHDSEYVHAIDTATGRQSWRYQADRRAPYPDAFMLGVQNGNVVVCYDNQVIGLRLKSGKLDWFFNCDSQQDVNDVISGRGCVTDDHVYLPMEEALWVLDNRGRLVKKIPAPGASKTDLRTLRIPSDYGVTESGGTAMVFSDMILLANREHVAVAFDADAVLQSLLEQLATRETDADLLSRIANLYRRQGNLHRAAEYFERALKVAGDTAYATDYAKLRLDLGETYLQLNQMAWEDRRLPAASEALARAEAVASSFALRLEVTKRFLEQNYGVDSVPQAIEWLETLRERHGSELEVFPTVSSYAISVTTFTSLRLAEKYLELEDFSGALRELQVILASHPEDRLGDQTAADVVQQRTVKLFELAGSDLQAEYNANATESFRRAADAADVERLSLLLKLYPNAETAAVYSAELCELLFEDQQFGALLQAGCRLLRLSEQKEPLAKALTVMVRAADTIGNHRLVAALVEAWPHFCDGPAPAELAVLAERANSSATTSVPKDAIRLLQSIELAQPTHLVGGDFHLAGEPLPATFDKCLLLGHMELRCLDPLSEQIVWQVDLPEAEQQAWLIKFAHVANTIVVRRDRSLLALDRDSGEQLWMMTDSDFKAADAAAGLLVVVRRVANRDAVSLEMLGIEPRSGTVLWSKVLSGQHFQSPLGVNGRYLSVISEPLDRANMVEFFDALTGEALLPPKRTIRGTSIRPFVIPDVEIAVFCEIEKPTSTRNLSITGYTVNNISAYQLRSGEKRWHIDLGVRDHQIHSVHQMANTVVIETARQRALFAIDGQTGKHLNEFVMPPFLSEVRTPLSDREQGTLLICLPIRVHGSEVSLMVVDEGVQELWMTRLPIPENTIAHQTPALMFHRGDVVVILFDRRVEGNRKVCDIYSFQAETGAMLGVESIGRPSSGGAQLAAGAERW